MSTPTPKIPLTVQQAEESGLTKVDVEEQKPTGGVHFDAQNDGEICYMSPCMNGSRYIYYWIDRKCSLGYIQPC